MRWEKDPDRLVGLFAATAHQPLWRRTVRLLLPLLVGVVCTVLVCAPMLVRW